MSWPDFCLVSDPNRHHCSPLTLSTCVDVPVRSPEFGVDLQGFGQHLGPHVSRGISADVQFGQRGVAAQSVEDDGEVGLQLGISQRQRSQRLQGEKDC